MKILSAEQIRALDAYTIENEPITSIDLMERASLTFVKWFEKKFPLSSSPIYIFCGIGNNGGDGLAIARLLYERSYEVTVFTCEINAKKSKDFLLNLERLPKRSLQPIRLEKNNAFPKLEKDGIIIDAIFGSGLNRAVEGYWSELISYLNNLPNTIVAVDIPSGLFADVLTQGIAIHADHTFSFEFPKLAFLFPSNQDKVGKWDFLTIGLHQDFIQQIPTSNFYIDKKFVQRFLKTRKKFAHKGTFGHALLIGGSYGMVGAAVMATKAALRVGTGLVTVHAPRCAYTILQISVPEAMVSLDENEFHFSTLPSDKLLEKCNAIGIGCGLGTNKKTVKALFDVLQKIKQPIVLDADALNIISQNEEHLNLIPPNSILTPHPKEFERLFGTTKNEIERFELQKHFSKKHNIYILLKGAHTCITSPNGNAYFNSTGNPGMATGGSGDVLTGIITGLLAQGYNPLEASTLGAYLHGLAGDLAVKEGSPEAMLASDIIEYLGKAFREIRKL